MSKASRFAEEVRSGAPYPIAPTFTIPHQKFMATVDNQGGLLIVKGKSLNPPAALEFAKWLRETFED